MLGWSWRVTWLPEGEFGCGEAGRVVKCGLRELHVGWGGDGTLFPAFTGNRHDIDCTTTLYTRW